MTFDTLVIPENLSRVQRARGIEEKFSKNKKKRQKGNKKEKDFEKILEESLGKKTIPRGLSAQTPDYIVSLSIPAVSRSIYGGDKASQIVPIKEYSPNKIDIIV